MRRRAAALLLLSALGSTPLAAQSADSVVARAAAAYRGLASLGADFDQVVANDMIGTFKSRGTLAQAGASRLAMRFTDPPGEAIVVDGTYLWLYTPSTAPGQVLRTPLAGATGYGVNLLAWLLDRPAERYRASLLPDTTIGGTPVQVVRLVPIAAGLPFSDATVWLGKADALPRRLQVVELAGNRRTLTLSHLRPDQAFPAGTFTFVPPAGVRVVDR